MRILIAEADFGLLQEMQEALEDAGHEVSTSRNGISAWDYLTGAPPPDLLVTCFHLGLGMPPGTALGRRAHARLPPIPVIYLAANDEEVEYADADHGLVLVKPFALTHLVETAGRLLPGGDLEDACKTPLPALKTSPPSWTN